MAGPKTKSYHKWINNYLYIDDGFHNFIPSRLLFFALYHVFSIAGLYMLVKNPVYPVLFFQYGINMWGLLSITGGAHRLWSHKCYSARWPLKLFFVLGYIVSGFMSLYQWILEHRVHHKFTDTDADPYNAKRGFFFAHIGWLMQKKHPLFYEKAQTISMEDIKQEKLIMIQKKHYFSALILFSICIPTMIPVYLWDVDWKYSFCINTWRLLASIHLAAFVNSAAHMFGDKPYNDRYTAVQNTLVSLGALGEGYHNYHHAFPQDYAASEDGFSFTLNPTKRFIDLMASIGMAYDLKRPTLKSIELVKQKMADSKGIKL